MKRTSIVHLVVLIFYLLIWIASLEAQTKVKSVSFEYSHIPCSVSNFDSYHSTTITDTIYADSRDGTSGVTNQISTSLYSATDSINFFQSNYFSYPNQFGDSDRYKWTNLATCTIDFKNRLLKKIEIGNVYDDTYRNLFENGHATLYLNDTHFDIDSKKKASIKFSGDSIQYLLNEISYYRQYGGNHGWNTYQGGSLVTTRLDANSYIIIEITFESIDDVPQKQATLFRSIAYNHYLSLLTFNTPLNVREYFCFDLLGRKHNLEFLGTDGSASTYSVRSLRPGVYFVSDGKEMVKFLISE